MLKQKSRINKYFFKLYFQTLFHYILSFLPSVSIAIDEYNRMVWVFVFSNINNCTRNFNITSNLALSSTISILSGVVLWDSFTSDVIVASLSGVSWLFVCLFVCLFCVCVCFCRRLLGS